MVKLRRRSGRIVAPTLIVGSKPNKQGHESERRCRFMAAENVG